MIIKPYTVVLTNFNIQNTYNDTLPYMATHGPSIVVVQCVHHCNEHSYTCMYIHMQIN